MWHVTLVLQSLLNRGHVEHVESSEILVRRLVEENGTEHEGELDRYPLAKFKRSNTGTCYNQRPIVSVGDVVEYNEICRWSFNGIR